MKTMICLILDRSGSMAGREGDVIGGINTFLSEQQKLPDPAAIAMVRFDSEAIERFRPMVDLKEIKPLTAEDYKPRSGTPLLQTIGQTLLELEEDWKREKPERAIVVIVTDGHENTPREFTKAQVKQMIEARQESGLWSFIYLGADVNAFDEARGLGIAAANTAGYQKTSGGVKYASASLSAAVGSMRMTGEAFASNLNKNMGSAEDGSEDTAANPTTPPEAVKAAPPTSAVPPASAAAWTLPTGTAAAPLPVGGVGVVTGVWTPPGGGGGTDSTTKAWMPPA